MLRNSMGACAMVRMGRGARCGRIARGVGGGIGAIAGGSSAAGYYPAVGATTTPPAAAMSFTSPPQPRFIYQTNPTLTAASPVAAAATASPQFYAGQGFIWPRNLGGGGGNKRGMVDNRLPWWPKGVDAGGGCVSSRGKLKHKLILVFPKSHLCNTL